MKAIFVALWGASVLAGCASTPKVTIDSAPGAELGASRTYSWSVLPASGAPLVDQRIVAGIDARLDAKGWKRQAQGGQITLAAHVATRQQQSRETFYTGTALGGWGWRGRAGWIGGPGIAQSTTRVNEYEVGSLVVDMFDTGTHQAIWRGTASGTVPASPAKLDAALDAGLDKMFAAFPMQQAHAH